MISPPGDDTCRDSNTHPYTTMPDNSVNPALIHHLTHATACPWDLAHSSRRAEGAQCGLSCPYCWVIWNLESRARKAKAPALPFLTPTRVQVVERLMSRTANSELRTSSIHCPATGCTSLLPNVWKSASRTNLLALREAPWSQGPSYAFTYFHAKVW